jgi:hypothetical protein
MKLVEIGERIKEQEKEQETDYGFLFEDEKAPVQERPKYLPRYVVCRYM